MTPRKFVYNIDYIHILSFREQYKAAISPYFAYDKIEYSIENENTILESIRLIFRAEGFVLQFRKEGITLLYEGDISIVKKKNPVVDIFFEIFERIKKFDGFIKTTRHKIVLDSVEIIDDEELVNKELKNNTFLKNPFTDLNDFSCVYEFLKEDKKCIFEFGIYNERDIKRYDLSPLRTDYNSDLSKGKTGFMCRTTVELESDVISYSKFKNLIEDSENIIQQFKDKTK